VCDAEGYAVKIYVALFVRALSNGNIAVPVDNKVYEGKPVNAGYKQPHLPNRKGKAKAFPFVVL